MRRFLRDNSLSIFFGIAFLAALGGQAIAGHIAYNADQAAHGQQAISFGRYLTSSAFGQAVTENWQSEYLQFTLFIVVTVWLVQRGSPESKEVEEAGRGSDREQRIGRYAGRGAPTWARVGGWRTAIFGNSLLIVMGVIFLLSLFAQSVNGWNEYNDTPKKTARPLSRRKPFRATPSVVGQPDDDEVGEPCRDTAQIDGEHCTHAANVERRPVVTGRRLSLSRTAGRYSGLALEVGLT